MHQKYNDMKGNWGGGVVGVERVLVKLKLRNGRPSKTPKKYPSLLNTHNLLRFLSDNPYLEPNQPNALH